MIKRTTIIAFFLLSIFTGGIFFQAFYSSKDAKIEEMLTQEMTMPRNEEKYPNKQMRSGVVKDLWINDKEMGRLHHHIESPRSILTAIPHGNRFELIEQMIGMKCYFQEKIEENDGTFTQQIRYLQSAEGTYRYTDQYFDAHMVFLALYHVPGQTLITKLKKHDPYLKGVAKEVSLSFSGGSPNFHAEKFKAQIRPKEAH